MTRLLPALLLLLSGAAGQARAATTVASDPAPIILGRAQVVTLTLQLDPALVAAPGALHVAANVGDLSFPVDLGGGKFKATYAPPPTKFPQMAVLAVWKETAGAPPVEFVRLPLNGVTKIDASSRPGAELRARVGEETYGPAIANARGQGTISVVIPPGATDMVLLAKTGGMVTERTIAVEVPPYNRMAAVVTPSSIGPGFGAARLEVLYDAPGGTVDPRKVTVKASAGTLAFESAEGPRLHYRYELRGAAPGEVTFSVAAEGDRTSSATVIVRRSGALEYGLRVGARLGLTHSLGALVGPRYAADAWAPLRLGGLTFGVGLTAGYGSADQTVLGPGAVPVARSEVSMVPLTLRAGIIPLEAGDFALVAGGGLTGTVTNYRISPPAGGAATESLTRFAPGPMLFAGAAWSVGPGQLFGEVTLTWASLDDPDLRLETGGVGVEIGYRFDVLGGGR